MRGIYNHSLNKKLLLLKTIKRKLRNHLLLL